MTSIYAAIVQGGVMNGTFATVTGANPAGNVEAFAAQIKKGSPELADVELRHMTVFGPWESFALVPEDVGGATKGRGLAPNIALSSLIGATATTFSWCASRRPFIRRLRLWRQVRPRRLLRYIIRRTPSNPPKPRLPGGDVSAGVSR